MLNTLKWLTLGCILVTLILNYWWLEKSKELYIVGGGIFFWLTSVILLGFCFQYHADFGIWDIVLLVLLVFAVAIIFFFAPYEYIYLRGPKPLPKKDRKPVTANGTANVLTTPRGLRFDVA